MVKSRQRESGGVGGAPKGKIGGGLAAAALGVMLTLVDKAGVEMHPAWIIIGGLAVFGGLAYAVWEWLRSKYPSSSYALVAVTLTVIAPSVWWLSRAYYVGVGARQQREAQPRSAPPVHRPDLKRLNAAELKDHVQAFTKRGWDYVREVDAARHARAKVHAEAITMRSALPKDEAERQTQEFSRDYEALIVLQADDFNLRFRPEAVALREEVIRRLSESYRRRELDKAYENTLTSDNMRAVLRDLADLAAAL